MQLSYKLKTPVAWNGQTITELRYRRPKGRDMRRFANFTGQDGDRVHLILETLCEMPAEVFDELDGVDYLGLSEAITPLLNGSPAT